MLYPSVLHHDFGQEERQALMREANKQRLGNLISRLKKQPREAYSYKFHILPEQHARNT